MNRVSIGTKILEIDYTNKEVVLNVKKNIYISKKL
jgi:hypothetical protein